MHSKMGLAKVLTSLSKALQYTLPFVANGALGRRGIRIPKRFQLAARQSQGMCMCEHGLRECDNVEETTWDGKCGLCGIQLPSTYFPEDWRERGPRRGR